MQRSLHFAGRPCKLRMKREKPPAIGAKRPNVLSNAAIRARFHRNMTEPADVVRPILRRYGAMHNGTR
jgi:hypothetical protein